MYDTHINKNVLQIILLMKEHNKKAKYVDISILLWFCTVCRSVAVVSLQTPVCRSVAVVSLQTPGQHE